MGENVKDGCEFIAMKGCLLRRLLCDCEPINICNNCMGLPPTISWMLHWLPLSQRNIVVRARNSIWLPHRSSPLNIFQSSATYAGWIAWDCLFMSSLETHSYLWSGKRGSEICIWFILFNEPNIDCAQTNCWVVAFLLVLEFDIYWVDVYLYYLKLTHLPPKRHLRNICPE